MNLLLCHWGGGVDVLHSNMYLYLLANLPIDWLKIHFEITNQSDSL